MVNVHDPEYNKELIVKELELLWRHLAIPEERCMEDCIPMHLLRAEAFAEEGLRLGGGDEFLRYANEVRRLRKEIMGTQSHSGEGESLEGVSEFNQTPQIPSLTYGSPPIEIERGKEVWIEHFIPKEACAIGSFRVIKPNPEHILTICCPVGEFDEETNRCKVGTIRQKLEHLHPEESSCPVCGG